MIMRKSIIINTANYRLNCAKLTNVMHLNDPPKFEIENSDARINRKFI